MEPSHFTHAVPVPSGGSQVNPMQMNNPDERDPLPLSKGIVQPNALPPVASTTFEGFGYSDNPTENGGFSFIPPDPSGAAGTSHLVAVVNTMIEVRTKTGTLVFRDSLKDFFAASGGAGALGTRPFDPKVIYDPYEDRFLVVALEMKASSHSTRILLAISKTGAPLSATTADWNFFAINSKIYISGTSHWADYPGFEVDEEAVYITANMYSFNSGSFGGVRLWIVNKGVVGGLYAGGSASFSVYNPIPGGFFGLTTMPCQVYGAGGVGTGIGTFLVGYDGLTDGVSEAVQVIRVNTPLSAPTFTAEFVALGDIDTDTFSDLPDAPQSGTGTLIEVNDRRALDCVWRDGQLWMVTTIKPGSGTDSGQTTAHWVRLDTSAITTSASPAGLIALSDQGNIGGEDIASGAYTFLPSVAVNGAGAAQFGFSASASSLFAGAFVAGREVGDSAGTVQASWTVKAGEDCYIKTFGGPENRWGDYSGISVDPTDDSFWVFNQFADTRSGGSCSESGRWGTAWANTTFSTSPTTTTTSTTTTTTTTTTSTTTTATSTTSTTTTTTTTTTTLPGLTCNGLPVTIVGTSGNDTLKGTSGADVIAGLGGNDKIYGKGGDDVICGGDGKDRLYGDDGNDILLGENGNDSLKGGKGEDTLLGGDGNDSLRGENGNDALDGGNNTDSCSGGSGTDTAVNCESTRRIP